ncbi:hypothetical protein ACS04_32950 [Streptomyces roseus]|uniref:HNH nuclease domain-containing protein n=1 Tax=Streptomyces roseus TaxID=66430 RepID=A0A0J6XCX9_9ACTN|nr:hypothetical protein ACS04_32950 [Streptomyces roseus]
MAERTPSTEKCTAADCERPQWARKLCNPCLSRAYRRGEIERVQVHGRTGGDVKGCESPHHANGYCKIHDANERRIGQPVAPKVVIRGTIEERWLAKVIPTPDGHWLWPESPKGCPYPKLGVKIDGRWTTEYAHHVAYRWAHGALPESGVVHHTCGLRLCSNPDHLQSVDAVANILEMKQRISLEREIEMLTAAVAALEAALGLDVPIDDQEGGNDASMA